MAFGLIQIMWSLIGIGALVLVWVLMSYKHQCIIWEMTGSTPIITYDKFRERRDKKTQATEWVLLKARKVVKPPNEAVVSVTTGFIGGGKKVVAAVKSKEGNFHFAKIPIEKDKIMEGWEPELLPVKYEERAFLAAEIKDANSRAKSDWLRQNIMPLSAMTMVCILAIVGLMFWEDIWRPTHQAQQLGIQLQKENANLATLLVDITQKQAAIYGAVSGVPIDMGPQDIDKSGVTPPGGGVAPK